MAATTRRDAYTAVMVGLLQIEDCLDADGGIVLPPGVTLISLIDRNIANVGDSVAYRYLDFTRSEAGQRHRADLDPTRCPAASHRCARAAGRRRAATGWRSWRRRASTTSPASSRRSRREPSRCRCSRPSCRATPNVSKPRCTTARPTVVLTTAAARDVVEAFLATMSTAGRPHVIVIDEIPDSAAEAFAPVDDRRRRRLPPAVHRRARRGPRSASRSPTGRSAPTCCR